MIAFIQEQNPWEGVGSGLAEGYLRGADERAIQKSIEGLGENASPRDILNAVTKTKTYNPETKKNFIKQQMEASQFEMLEKEHKLKLAQIQQEALNKKEKKELDKGNALGVVDNSDLSDEKKQLLRNDIEEGKVDLTGVKEIVKPKKTEESPFTKALGKKHVEQYTKAEESLIQSQRNLKDLNRVEELNNKLAGPLGYFSALNPFNEEASELSSLGFGVIEPIVKTFNPSGPIAQKKLEQLQKLYGINRTDSSATIRGKVSALRRYANYAKEIAEQRLALFKKYEGSPPIGEVARLDALAEDISDQMAKEKPSEPSIFYSVKTGKPIKTDTLEQQEQFLKQGLITDVKPTK